MKLDNMYQEIILDHYRHPHGKGLREHSAAQVTHINPTCGDEVTVQVGLDASGGLVLGYEGQGCSISQASASVMSELLAGGRFQTDLADYPPGDYRELTEAASAVYGVPVEWIAVAIERADGLPSTFVPGRNLVFLTFAAIVAFQRGIKRVVTGVCETDFSGYPDCRDDTIKALQVALNLGMDRRFVLHTPLMWLDKAETWQLADRLGGTALVEIVLAHTHTCYMSERGPRNAWGHGCGECPSCALRKRGFEKWRAG